jgi:hypothetical protein
MRRINARLQVKLYASLMEEAKCRIFCCRKMADNRNMFPLQVVHEFCFLQLRLLCEVIALSCLVAHGDIPIISNGSLKREYSADKIIKAMTKLREDFYPFPIVVNQGIDKNNELHFEIIENVFSKDDLSKLYAQSHQYLHRGSLQKLTKIQSKDIKGINLRDIVIWTNKIDKHLSTHFIPIGKKRVMFYSLEKNGYIFSGTFKSIKALE